jgi:hypothetical protein
MTSITEPFEMPTTPGLKKSNHVLRWIGAGVVGLFIIGGIAGSNHSSSSGNSDTNTTSYSKVNDTRSAASVESNYVTSTCTSALSVPISNGTGMTIGDGISAGYMTVSQAANAFAGGYYSSSSNLSYSQVVSACMSGLQN